MRGLSGGAALEKLLPGLTGAYRRILGEALVGIYLHGSAAFGCFRWERSDLDFLVVVGREPNLREKSALVRTLLELAGPPKGFEMSVVLERDCRLFPYPTPYCLHFSQAHLAACRLDLEGFCRSMHGTDPDLAAHFTVVRAVGIPLCGKPVAAVFGPVPWPDYIDSIRRDVQRAEQEITEHPVSVVLNLCRVLAAQRDGVVLSKEQGGAWGRRHLPPAYAPLVEDATRSYRAGAPFPAGAQTLQRFARYMTGQIFQD